MAGTLESVDQHTQRVETIDVEKVLWESSPHDGMISEQNLDTSLLDQSKQLQIFAVDDSIVGIAPMLDTGRQLGLMWLRPEMAREPWRYCNSLRIPVRT